VHEIPNDIFVGAAGVGVGQVLEPLALGRHVGQPVKTRRRSAAG
jgi:hypothetical protein